MIRYSLAAILGILALSPAKAKDPAFAHFLEPGFPFCGITVDARKLGKEFPKDNLSPRGLVVRVADDTYVAYDTDLCRMAVAWSGGFLTEESLALKSYQEAKAKKGGGQKILPAPIGKALSANGLYPGVQVGKKPRFTDPRPPGKAKEEIGRGALPKGMARWVSSVVIGERVKLNYEIGGIAIQEVPSALSQSAVVRYFQVAPHPEVVLSFLVGSGSCQGINLPAGSEMKEQNGINYLVLEQSDSVQEFAIVQSRRRYEGKLPGSKLPGEWEVMSEHWPESVVTKGRLAPDVTDYVVDEIPLPSDNFYRRNVRPIDIDFGDGYAVVVTFDGDLWEVRGLQGDLQNVEWQRIASGLHEPCGVRVREDGIFVFGRNGVTRVISDDRSLVFENYSSDFWQSADSRDFAHSLDFDHDGNLFLSKGGQQNDYPSKHSGRVLKIDQDKKVGVFASGLRNPYLSVRPGTDEIYASDQQGHWVPATPIHRIVEGGYYGFQPAAPWGVPEPELTPPLCWIPHTVANSGLGVIWSDKTRFGPLSDSLIYLDYTGPRVIRTYLNERDGQAASVPMPVDINFPILKGAINPSDGQLYLLGFQIWGSNSDAIRGMARLRYTGKSSVLPTRIVAGKNAVALHFDEPLDPTGGRVTARRWNYKRAATYGSGHYRPDGKSGEELLPVSQVRYSEDRRSILVATPELDRVDQLAVSYELKTASGRSFTDSAYLTLHHTTPLDLKQEGFPDTDLSKLAATADEQATEVVVKPTIIRGSVIYKTIGCIACHSIDGSTKGRSGPSWKGLAGSKRKLLGGKTAEVTPEYLRESILEPAAKVAEGYNPKDVGMPSYRGILSESDVESLILYIQSLKK